MSVLTRIAASLLGAALLACCACAAKPADASPSFAPSAAPSATAAPAPASPAPSAAPVAETAPTAHTQAYGERVALTADRNGFVGELRYPLGGVDIVNTAISAWAVETFAGYETRAASLKADENGVKATLTVDYETFLFAGRYLGVKETGRFTASVGGAEPVLYGYNCDLAEGRALTLADVVSANELDAIAALITQRLLLTDGSALGGKTALSADDLTRFVIRDDGIEWLFSGASDVVGVLLGYDALAPYLLLDPTVETALPLAAPSAADTPDIEQTATSLFDGVHVRSKPSDADSNLLGVLSAGERVDVVKASAERGWHAVWYNGQTGYVFAALVRLSDDPDAYAVGYVTSSYLHVRDRASVRGELLGTLQTDERVQVVDPNPINGWYKIWFEGQFAYVSADYVHIGSKPIGLAQSAPTAAPSELTAEPRIVSSAKVNLRGVGTCAASGVIVRSEPDVQSAQYTKLYRGDQVYFVAREYTAGWDQIFVFTAAKRGYIGYIQSRYVSAGDVAPS